jgi:hypothetical protein
MSKTLTKEFGLLKVDLAGGVYNINQNLSYSGWRPVSTQAFIADTYFDLAGLSMDDKTLFFDGAAMQEVLPPAQTTAAAGDLVNVVDIMSSIPMTDSEVALFVTRGNMMGSGTGLTFHETIFARNRVFNTDLDNQAGGYFISLGDNQLGSLEPTASDRIYCYRYVAVALTGPVTSLEVYPARYILRARAKEEPEYEYLMRLKRSYELQNEPDRD